MASNTAQYQVIVNWDKPSTVVIDDFEGSSLNGWVATPGGELDFYSYLPQHSGAMAMYLHHTSGGMDPQELCTKVLTGLVPGTVYVVQAWAYPYDNAYHVKFSCDNALYETYTHIRNEWQLLETSFEATSSTHTIRVSDLPGPQPSTIFFGAMLDDISLTTAGDDITELVLGNSDISFTEGRDQARSLSAVGPSDTDFEFKNEDRNYSPANPLSVLYSRPGSGAAMQIRALFEGRFYTLFNGYIDDFVINQELPTESTVQVSAFDQLGRMGSVEISTALYQTIRTNEAIDVVLDEIGWPKEKRILDVGSTVMNWWWEEGTTALEAVTNIVSSEGLPAFIYIDELNNFVFRNRHHRFFWGDSDQVVAYFEECDGDDVLESVTV